MPRATGSRMTIVAWREHLRRVAIGAIFTAVLSRIQTSMDAREERMRRALSFLAIVVLAGVFGGCGPRVTLPPVTVEDVEVLTEEPEEEFEEIADIRQQAATNTPRADVIAGAREKAASYGADALWIKEWRVSASVSNPTVTLLAVAIYYPSRHPEIERDPGTS